MKKFIILTILIILSRALDLYTTYVSTIDFKTQEQNLIVKIFDLSFNQFVYFEIITISLVIYLYYYSIQKKEVFLYNVANFKQYLKVYFYNKSTLSTSSLFFSMKLSRIFLLMGAIAPYYIIPTSLLFSVNNYFVNLYVKGNLTVIKHYKNLDSFYFFDFIIFIVPPLFLIILSLRYLYLKYLASK